MFGHSGQGFVAARESGGRDPDWLLN